MFEHTIYEFRLSTDVAIVSTTPDRPVVFPPVWTQARGFVVFVVPCGLPEPAPPRGAGAGRRTWALFEIGIVACDDADADLSVATAAVAAAPVPLFDREQYREEIGTRYPLFQVARWYWNRARLRRSDIGATLRPRGFGNHDTLYSKRFAAGRKIAN